MRKLIRYQKWFRFLGIVILATGCSGTVQQSVSQKQFAAEKVRWTLPEKAILNSLDAALSHLVSPPGDAKSYVIEINGKPAGQYPSLRCTGPKAWYCSEVPRKGVEQIGIHKDVASTVVLEPGRYAVTIGRATKLGSVTLDSEVFRAMIEFKAEANKRYSYATMYSQGKYWAWIQRSDPGPKKGRFDASQTFEVVGGVAAPDYINAMKKVTITR
jgi:hypothetical protein